MVRSCTGLWLTLLSVWPSIAAASGPPDCCFSHGYAGCDDFSCQQAVCGTNPFCCFLFWDQACADEARALCDVCAVCGDGIVGFGEECDPPNGFSCDAACQLGVCATSTEPCCTANPSPGCENDSCCETVCACDSYCCEFEWDVQCATNGFGGNGCGADVLCDCAICGNGMVESSEQCEPPNTSTCNASCQSIVCGDGVVDAQEQCDPPDGVSCNAICQLIQCGDGVIEGSEECDPPNGFLCDATCQYGPCSEGVGDCCEEHLTPGCAEGSCCAAVCACDTFCCTNEWDGYCSGTGFGGNGCGAAVLCSCPVCGDGILAAGEQCEPPNTSTCDANCQSIDCGPLMLRGWGWNDFGQTNTPSGSFVAIAAGYAHSLAIRMDGTLAGWGRNDYGEINVPSGTFTAVAAGDTHGLAIRSDGTLVGWGDNTMGQIDVPSGTFIAVAAGEVHSLALRSDGTLVGWGNNSYGQINVPSGTFSAVGAGNLHSLAIRSDGTLVGWGWNPYGQTNVPSGIFTAVAGGAIYSIAMRSDGTLVGWGETDVPAGAFTAVTAGDQHGLAITSGATVVGWGNNSYGQLSVPSQPFTSVAAGGYHSLALTPCGNGIVACGEECDDGANNSDSTPDACRTTCVLPSCGDDVVDTGEQCDPPEASSCDANCQTLISAVQPEPAGAGKNRYVSFIVPTAASGANTAVRVKLTSLHHPAGPPNAPNFSAFEGQYRYLNAIRDAANNPVFVCPDSAALGSSYNCAKLGCVPEYRDWAGIFGGAVVHVTGDSLVPSSQYAVAHLASSCAGNEAACTAASAELTVSTERWGNVDNTPAGGTPNAIDIGFIVSKVKDAPGSFIESRCQLQGPTPNPYGLAVNALDIGRGVDAVKGLPYPFTISVCP